MIQALESDGQIDENGYLQLDSSPPVKDKRVKVIVLVPEDDEIHDTQWLRAASKSEAFNFLNDPAEDLYSV